MNEPREAVGVHSRTFHNFRRHRLRRLIASATSMLLLVVGFSVVVSSPASATGGACAATCTVTYNTEGGSTAPTDSGLYLPGATVTVNTSTPTQTHYTFAGWCSVTLSAGSTCASAGGTTYGATFSMGTLNVTLYAIWTAGTLTVTYNTEGGSTAPTDSGLYAPGDTVTVNTSTPTQTHYTFAGWCSVTLGAGSTCASASGTTYGATFSMGSSNVTLYAIWTPNVSETVTFNNNTGTGSMSNETENYNVATNLTANTFTKTGYTFTGWNTQAGGGGTNYLDQASYPFTASTTLYAQWSANTSVSDPTPPIDVTAKPGDASATVTWTVPASDGGAPITGYVVTSGPGGFTCTVSDPSVLACVVNGLTNGTTYTFTVEAINSHSSSTPGGPSNRVVPRRPVVKRPREVIVILDPFVTASAVLLPKMKSQLINLAKLIKKYVGTSLSITGFTDSRENASYNYTLGLNRAKSAYVFLHDELRTLHVKINFRITVVSKGLTSAAASNASVAGQAKNRRVVLIAWLN